MTGTVDGNTALSNVVNGDGTEFSDELAVGDTIRIESSAGNDTKVVQTINSNTQLLVTSDFALNHSGGNIFRVQSFTYGPALELFTVNYIKPESTVYETDGTFNVSELSYNMVIGIRSDAWPAS